MSLASRVDSLEDRLFALEVAVQRLIAQVGDSESSKHQLVAEGPRPEPRRSGLGPRPSLVQTPRVP